MNKTNYNDFIGKEFGNFLVLDICIKNDRKYCQCLCSCGNPYLIQCYKMVNYLPKSCGCLDVEDLSGMVFGKLYVIKTSGKDIFNKYRSECMCSCGNIKVITNDSLRGGHTKSCGCLKLIGNNTTHGQSKKGKWSLEYATYRSMLQRCYDKNLPRYKDYGGRGITVCDRWKDSFENFFEDMGKKPTRKHSLDRIDNDKGY